MKKIIIYSYSKCSTCKKASKWLDQKNISYELKDIVKEPPSESILKLALIQFSSNRKKIFNTRGKSFKEIEIDINKISNEQMIELLSNDGKLIKRPFLVINKSKLILGFNEEEYSDNFV